MSELKVIMFHGKQGSGKTTTTKELSESLIVLGYEPVIFSFAKPLYEVRDRIVADFKNTYGIEVRDNYKQILQPLGDMGRSVDNYAFANAALKFVKEYPKSDKTVFICDDLRFKVEYDVFSEVALFVLLDAPEDVRRDRLGVNFRDTSHSSENDLESYISRGAFDMYFTTHDTPTKDIVNYIVVVGMLR